ncbi:DNA gyrase inhibitor YacG [uncultured Algimonas sp.]|uniref:DNA gyrase inhibitor YacG n=1 Tax=uncultured Algimonas sp. TaxID=1547920 RepID=UPI002604C328|nr:DNA gyrase inhibitor YacG [uncultured Algimonas sp.]
MSRTCPICKTRDVVADYRPFCSKRCADIDLGRWFKGGYAIPTQERAPDGDTLPDPAND